MTEIVRCFFFNDTATTEIYTLSLHDALPIFGVFTFMTQWTSYLWPLVISTREDMLTLTVGVQSLRSLFTVNWGVLSAGAVLSMLPLILVFLFLPRYFIAGSIAGALKE